MPIERKNIFPDKTDVRKTKDGRILYSQVVTVSGADKHVFVAGQIARDIDGKTVGRGDMAAQIVQVGENIKACLEAAGATLDDVVKTTTYVTDIEEYFKYPDERLRYFSKAAPTSTTIEVSRLASPDFMVEVEAYALVGSGA